MKIYGLNKVIPNKNIHYIVLKDNKSNLYIIENENIIGYHCWFYSPVIHDIDHCDFNREVLNRIAHSIVWHVQHNKFAIPLDEMIECIRIQERKLSEKESRSIIKKYIEYFNKMIDVE